METEMSTIVYIDTENECAICMNGISTCTLCELKCCKKQMHKKCLLEWSIKKKSHNFTCPFCRAIIHNLFEYLSFGEISSWLIDWDYSYKVVVKNKQIQLLVDMNSVEQELDIADHNNEVTIIPTENVTPGNSTANVTNDYYNNILGWVMLIAFVIITFVPVIIFVFIPNNVG